MTIKKLNITEQFQKWMEGSFNNSNNEILLAAGWVDWDCKDSSLQVKTQVLYNRLSKIIKSPKLEQYGLTNLTLNLKTSQQTIGANKDYIIIKCINYCNVEFIVCLEECLHSMDNEILTHCFIKDNNKDKTSFVGTWEEFCKWFNSKNAEVKKQLHKKQIFKYEECETDLKDAAVNIVNRYNCFLITDFGNGEKPDKTQIGHAVRYEDGSGTLLIGTLRLDIDQKEMTSFFLTQN